MPHNSEFMKYPKVTRLQIDCRIARINIALGLPTVTYICKGGRNYIPQTGNIFVEKDITGYSIHQISESGGQSRPFGYGSYTKSELYAILGIILDTITLTKKSIK